MNGFTTIVRTLNLRHLTERRLRTTLTLAGVSAGVALVFSVSVINATVLTSMRESVRRLAGAAELEVAAPDQAGLSAETVQTIDEVDGVDLAVPVLRTLANVRGPKGSVRTAIAGIAESFPALFPSGLGEIASFRISGGFGRSRNGILLSEKVLDAVGVRTGETVPIDTPGGRRQVRVTGRIAGGAVGVFNGGDAAMMHLAAAQTLFSRPNRVDSVYVVLDPRVSVAAAQKAISERLHGAAIVGPPGERGRGFERILEPLSVLSSLGGTVALFVALFVVYNTMSMSLAERRREISLALAIGASRRHAFGAFLAEAAALGAVASAIGIAAGYAMARVLVQRALEGYDFIPVEAGGPVVVRGSQLVVAVASGVGVAVAGAIVPARRVARVAAVESLRPEAPYEWTPPAMARPPWLTPAAGLTVATGVAGVILAGRTPNLGWVANASALALFGGVSLLLPLVVPAAVRALRRGMTGAFGTAGRLASEALAKNPGRTTFTVAALLLTLATVIAVGSGLDSYAVHAERNALMFTEAPLYVAADSSNGVNADQPLPAALGERIGSIDGVRLAQAERVAWITVAGEPASVYAAPVRQTVEAGVGYAVGAARLAEDRDAFVSGLSRGEVALSRFTAKRVSARAGASVQIATPAGSRSFRVATVFDDFAAWDSLAMDYSTYASVWGDDRVDQFGIILEPGTDPAVVERRLEAFVADAGLAAAVFTRREVVGDIVSDVNASISLSRGIQFAALIVALFTIINTIFTAVLERRWEFGLQRAVGMSKRQLGRSVFLEAAGIGLIGGTGAAALGTVFGVLFLRSATTSFDWRIPYQLPWPLWVIAVAGSVALAAVAATYPRRLATRTPIIEALRYE